MDYCNEKLKRLEMYDNANGSFLIDTLLNYYMCGFNVQNNGTDDVRSSQFPAIPSEKDRRNTGNQP